MESGKSTVVIVFFCFFMDYFKLNEKLRVYLSYNTMWLEFRTEVHYFSVSVLLLTLEQRLTSFWRILDVHMLRKIEEDERPALPVLKKVYYFEFGRRIFLLCVKNKIHA